MIALLGILVIKFKTVIYIHVLAHLTEIAFRVYDLLVGSDAVEMKLFGDLQSCVVIGNQKMAAEGVHNNFLDGFTELLAVGMRSDLYQILV